MDERVIARRELPPALADKLWEDVPATAASSGRNIGVSVPSRLLCFDVDGDALDESEMPDWAWQEDPQARPMRLVLWESEHVRAPMNCAGLTPDARLRVNWGTDSREINLQDALYGAEVEALVRVPASSGHSSLQTLLVLGQGGVAVQVDIVESRGSEDMKPEAHTLWRGYKTDLSGQSENPTSTTQGSPAGLTGMLARALGLKPSAQVRADLAQPIVGSFPGPSAAVVVRQGGRIERWKVEPITSSSSMRQKCLQWETNLFDMCPTQSETHSRKVVDACDIGNGRLGAVVVVQNQDETELFLFVVDASNNTVPVSIEFQASIDKGPRQDLPDYILGKQWSICCSGGICYVVNAFEGVVDWMSLTPGLRLEQQVRGKIRNIWEGNQTCPIIGVCDVDTETLTSQGGGKVAVVARDRISIVSAKVPPPLEPQAAPTQSSRQENISLTMAEDVVMRAFLQLEASQFEAANATIESSSRKALAGDVHVRKALANGILHVSDSILAASESNLLIDDILRKKNTRHGVLMEALLQSTLISSQDGSCMWDLLDFNSKSRVLSNCEKLEAACRVRATENTYGRLETDEAFAGRDFLALVAREVCKDMRDGESSDESGHIQIFQYEYLTKFEKYLLVVHNVLSEHIHSFNETDENVGESLEILTREILAAAQVTLDCTAGAEVVRVEADSRLNTQDLDRKGGWSCSEQYCRVVKDMIDHVASIYDSSSQRSQDQIGQLGRGLVQAHLSMTKRALDPKNFVLSRQATLTKFQQQFGLLADVLDLARSFEDFEMMMEIMWCAPGDEYEPFLEEALQEFSEEFGFFCFSFLEQKGAYKRLLDRPASQRELLDNWFLENQDRLQHVQWMHELHRGRFGDAGIIALSQATGIAEVGKANSVANAKSLLSIAKLACQVSDRQEEMVEAERRLYLIRAQERLVSEVGEIVSIRDLVEKCVSESEIDTDVLAQNVGIALEIVNHGSLSLEESRELSDYAWIHSIAREQAIWQVLGAQTGDGALARSDEELREKLQTTAFFAAALENRLEPRDMKELIVRNVERLNGLSRKLGIESAALKTLACTAVQLAADTSVLTQSPGDDAMDTN